MVSEIPLLLWPVSTMTPTIPLMSVTLAQTPTKMPSWKSRCGIGEPPIMDFGIVCSSSSLIFNSYFPEITSNGIPCSLKVQAVCRVSRTCLQLHQQSHCKVACWWRRWFDLCINVSPQKFLACQTDSSFSRGGYHRNKWTKHCHYTLCTFKSNGIAYHMIYAFSSKHSAVFLNGRKVWKEGGYRLDVKQDCEQLWYAIALFFYLHIDIFIQIVHTYALVINWTTICWSLAHPIFGLLFATLFCLVQSPGLLSFFFAPSFALDPLLPHQETLTLLWLSLGVFDCLC